MEVVQTKPQSVLMIKLDVFEDHRGECMEPYNEELPCNREALLYEFADSR